MLTKEYRICLPMSVEEYRIAQLYMIQVFYNDKGFSIGSFPSIVSLVKLLEDF